MNHRTFGCTGEKLPVIGQGTWNMERDERRACVDAVRAGLDVGMTHIDTAEMYGSGEVEKIVGEAIEGRREEVYLVSKVLPDNASRKGTIEACEHSLKRLRTDRLDCYLLHWPGSRPLGDTIAAFEELRDSGKIRAWGLSNFAVPQLEEALAIAGKGKIACNQVLYHLKERSIEHEVISWCADHGVAVVAYSPFGSGDFPAGNVALREIAEHHNASPYQVALAFLTREEHVFAIPKAAQKEHVLQNAGAAEPKLAEDEIERIDSAFPRGRKRRGVPTL